jgi:hypothetical protein
MPFEPRIYRLACIAREKLCREIGRGSHDLRCIIAHAYLLDKLLIELEAPMGGPADHHRSDRLPRAAEEELESTTCPNCHPPPPTILPTQPHDAEAESESGFSSDPDYYSELSTESDMDSDDNDDADEDFASDFTPANASSRTTPII